MEYEGALPFRFAEGPVHHSCIDSFPSTNKAKLSKQHLQPSPDHLQPFYHNICDLTQRCIIYLRVYSEPRIHNPQTFKMELFTKIVNG